MRLTHVMPAVVAVIGVMASCSTPYDATRDADAGVDAAAPPAVDASSAPAPPPGPAPDAGPPLPECTAQRSVFIQAGNGGLAYFTLLWPAPAVITGFTTGYAYDDISRVTKVAGTKDGHDLYARKAGGKALWEGLGAHPMPTVMVAGTNETHTETPSSTVTLPDGSGTNVAAASATAEQTLEPAVVVLGFSGKVVGGTTFDPAYGHAPGAPSIVEFADIDSAVNSLASVATLTPAEADSLRPDPAKITLWGAAAGGANMVDLAQKLLFAANALRRGLLGTVVIPALNDDPHALFDDEVATATADALAGVLNGFYTELAAANELRCGHAGGPLSMADNVMLVVYGDTFKNPFQASPWGDGTPGGANLLYVRSNGWLEPGWFGQIAPTGKMDFDPASGDPIASAGQGVDATAAFSGIVFGASRGNQVYVSTLSQASFKGLVALPPP